MSQEFTEKYLKDNGFNLIDDVDAEGNTPLIKAVIEEGVTLVNALCVFRLKTATVKNN